MQKIHSFSPNTLKAIRSNPIFARMRAWLLLCLVGMLSSTLLAQDSQLNFELGSGLQFQLNGGAYTFTMGGMIQPSVALEQLSGGATDYFFNAKRSYFNFSGKAREEKVSFFLQTDFSLGQPLLDAWVAYHPMEQLSVTFGQKQSPANNREMLLMEDRLSFPDRSLLSETFSATGREFGWFVEGRFGTERFGIVPQIAITSGDGRNSFGVDSRDVDLGGFKYGARLDIYPLGFFSEGNDLAIADLAHEATPKLVLGYAASYNDGASHPAGEGHGDLFLYNSQGAPQLPDYRQVYMDLLFKFQGFSLLGEYAIATATSLEGSYVDALGVQRLLPTEISQYLALGRALHTQLGYVTQSGYALDLRYAHLAPEFGENDASLVEATTGLTVGFSKYFKGNDLKLQTAFSRFQQEGQADRLQGELVLQLRF